MIKVPKSEWRPLDDKKAIIVRQLTNRFRSNQWEVKNLKNERIILTDDEFEDYRNGILEIPWR